MGEDFNYQDANVWYKNLDKLIKWVLNIFLQVLFEQEYFQTNC